MKINSAENKFLSLAPRIKKICLFWCCKVNFYEYRNSYPALVREGIVVSFREGITSDLVGAVWNDGAPCHSTSNVPVMLLTAYRFFSLSEVNWVAFTGNPLDHSVYFIWANNVYCWRLMDYCLCLCLGNSAECCWFWIPPFERWFKELVVLLHLDEQIITPLHKTLFKDMHHL